MASTVYCSHNFPAIRISVCVHMLSNTSDDVIVCVVCRLRNTWPIWWPLGWQGRVSFIWLAMCMVLNVVVHFIVNKTIVIM